MNLCNIIRAKKFNGILMNDINNITTIIIYEL